MHEFKHERYHKEIEDSALTAADNKRRPLQNW